MPDRIIRDELLRSRRYRTLSSDTARLLFFHLLLSIDNLGNHEADDIAISDVMRRPLDPATTAKLLSELADVDLIRLYQDGDKSYLHVPRFRQRLKYLGSKHPRPPDEIECNEIKKLAEEYRLKATFRQVKGSTEANEVKRSEEKRSTTKPARANAEAVDKSGSTNAAANPQIKTILEKLTVKSEGPQPRSRDEQLAYVKVKTGK